MGIGDINADGISDFMLGGENQYVIFGNRNFSAAFDVSTLNGNNGFIINSTISFNFNTGSPFGDVNAELGDVNGDGVDDFMVGNYVIFGNKNGFAQYFDLNSLNGQNGFVIGSSGVTDWLGDVNNDGINDIIIGNNNGESYIIYGNKYEFHTPFNISMLNGNNGFTIFGTEGQSVSGLGDVNGDLTPYLRS